MLADSAHRERYLYHLPTRDSQSDSREAMSLKYGDEVHESSDDTLAFILQGNTICWPDRGAIGMTGLTTTSERGGSSAKAKGTMPNLQRRRAKIEGDGKIERSPLLDLQRTLGELDDRRKRSRRSTDCVRSCTDIEMRGRRSLNKPVCGPAWPDLEDDPGTLSRKDATIFREKLSECRLKPIVLTRICESAKNLWRIDEPNEFDSFDRRGERAEREAMAVEIKRRDLC